MPGADLPSLAALAPVHLVGLGGAVGALARHAVAELVDDGRLPTSTLTVNALGTFALCAVTFAGAETGWLLLVGTGACGAFTTFSTFSVDTVGLWERGEARLAATNAVGTLAAAGVGLGLAWLLASGL